jgi:hypothetical protein
MHRRRHALVVLALAGAAIHLPFGCGGDEPPTKTGNPGAGGSTGGSGGSAGSGGGAASGGSAGSPTGGAAGKGGSSGATGGASPDGAAGAGASVDGAAGTGGTGGASRDGAAGSGGTGDASRDGAGGAGGGADGSSGSGGTGGASRDGAAGAAGNTVPDAASDVPRSEGGSDVSGPTGDAGGCASGEIGTPPNCFPPPPVPPGSGRRWTVTFSEEFNGTDYDRKKLSPCFDWNYGACTNSFNKGREHYDPAQIAVSNGTAKLTAAPLVPPLSSTGCYQDQCTYKSGLLSTCRPNAGDGSAYLYAFTYGYVESRMKFPATQGFFTAFWMVPADPTYAYRSEIDIVEILGDDPNTIFMTYHYNNRTQSHAVNQGKGNNGSCAVKNYATEFHRFGLDWQPTHVAWYIDGIKCAEFAGTTAQIENGPMQIIIDLMVDHAWQQSWNVMLQDTTLVRQLELDYLRVYQQAP